MPSVHGSSRIQDISAISPLTGPTGASGTTGPTGSTGPIGPQGRVGFTGFGIVSSITGAYGTGGTDNNLTYEIIFNMSDFIGGAIGESRFTGTTFGVSGVRGGTGDIISDDFIITNIIESPNYGELFKEKIGFTAYFRNLTVSGRDIEITENDYEITLNGSTWGYGRMGNTGELLFINWELGGLSAQGALNTYWSGDQLTARILTHKELYNTSGDYNNNNIPDWGEDPINTSDIVSASGITGTSVTFSSIAYLDEDGLLGEPIGATAIASGIHLGGGENGTIYRFSGVTFDSKYIVEDILVGSCCYCKDGSGGNKLDHKDCVDYVTESYCNEMGGIFSTTVCLHRPEGPNCYSEGSCCINGTCVSTSENKCQSYGGFFIPGLDCTGEPSVESLGGCPYPCGIRGSCCINNECYELTEYECSFSPNSVWIDKPCAETNCCLEANMGACCVDEACFHTDSVICSSLISASGQGQSTGVFWGVNSRCAGLQKIPEYPGYTDASYFPFNCIIDGILYGELAPDGLCAIPDPVTGDRNPPCGGCDGWSQVMPTAPDSECEDALDDDSYACLCDTVCCECEPNCGQSYTCVDSDSCGTMVLADGKCWECCRNQPDFVDPISACCLDADGDGNFNCIPLTESKCNEEDGVFSPGKSCQVLNCNDGACCYPDGWCEPNTNPSYCSGEGGVWVGGDCSGKPCLSVRFLPAGAAKGIIPPRIIPTSNTRTKRALRKTNLNKTLLNTSKGRKSLEEPNFNDECVGSSNLSSCIEPGIALFSNDNDQVTIETGDGECSCCCPGICWGGALGIGGIVGDCKDIDSRCYPVFDSSDCNSAAKDVDLISLPTNKPICNKDYLWEKNSLGCIPYIDNTNSNNPIWMICSCCCDGTCKEYTTPIPCSECENRGQKCVCVNGCGNCLV